MSVYLETSKGDIVIDLFVEKAPKTCFNFIQMCQMKFYNDALVTFMQKDFIAKVEKLDPSSKEGNVPLKESIWSLTAQSKETKADKTYFADEVWPRRFDKRGLVATANQGPHLNTSSFFITLRADGEEIREFKNKHTIFGQVVEGLDVLEKINQVYTVGKDRPLQNIRIKHTMIIEDPFEG
jgi:peptidyl-prolyl cis-trans isomerase-like 4